MMEEPILRRIADEYLCEENSRIPPKQTRTKPTNRTVVERERRKRNLRDAKRYSPSFYNIVVDIGF